MSEQRDTKQLLMNKSQELFQKKDFDKISVDEICREAGVTKGAFYHYFTSKYDIPVQQYRMIQNEFYSDYEKNSSLDVAERLRHAIMWYSEYCNEDTLNIFTNYHKVMINYNKNRILRRIEIESRVFEELFNIGIAEGVFNDTLKVDFQCEMITRFIFSLLFDWVIFKGGVDLKRELEYLYNNIIHAVKS